MQKPQNFMKFRSKKRRKPLVVIKKSVFHITCQEFALYMLRLSYMLTETILKNRQKSKFH